jgi:hypothetical protein
MNPIIFDVTYQKRTEIDSIKLSPESEFQQLKIMLCGKYKIFDSSKLYIYYKNALLIPIDDTQKLKEIFKSKKIKIEISDQPLLKFVKKDMPENITQAGYLCKCGSNAVYLCEKCEEFICDFCQKQKRHITHDKNVIKLDEYSKYVKNTVKEMAGKLDEKIINDEAYKFLKYWTYDKEKEIKSVDAKYDFLKKLLEDIKQMEIDYLIFLNEGNDYDILKQKIMETINLFSNFDINEQNVSIEEIIKQKKNLVNISNDLFNRYNKIKFHLLNYTKNLKELQVFNEMFQKMIHEKFNFIKKRISAVNNNLQSMTILGRESIINNRYLTLNNDGLNNTTLLNNLDDKSNFNGNDSITKEKSTKLNFEEEKNKTSNNNKLISVKLNTNTYKLKASNNLSPKINRKHNNKYNSSTKMNGVIKIPELLDQKVTIRDKNKKLKNILSSPKLDTSLNTSNKNSNLNIKGKTLYKSLQFSPQTKSLNNINIYSHNKPHEHLLFKLKNRLKILIFSYENQNFTEKNYVDRANFKKELTSEKDIIQLNLNNKLYLLSGKKHNKLYCYDHQSNSIYFINNTIYSHYLGTFVYCPKNKYIYLIGGNSQPGCEMYLPGQTLISNFNSSTITLNKFNQKKTFWKKISDLNEERQEFASMYFNDFIYIFFGFSHLRGKNLSSIERINVDKNDKFEVVYINEQITLSSLSCALYHPEFDHGWEKEGILLLGGFDGEKYVESSFVFTPDKMKIRECDVIIPNITKHFQFLFHQESNFMQLDVNNSPQFIFDMKNNVHVLTKDSYELLSEVQ